MAIALAYPLAAPAQTSGKGKQWCHMTEKVGAWKVISWSGRTSISAVFSWERLASAPQGSSPRGEFQINVANDDGKIKWAMLDLPIAQLHNAHLRFAIDGNLVFDGPVGTTKSAGTPFLSLTDPTTEIRVERIMDRVLPRLASGSRAQIVVGASSAEPWLRASFPVAGFREAANKAIRLGRYVAEQTPVRGECEDCFITTAVCRNVGLEDDCFELRSLRAFRDGALQRLPGGPEAVQQYYAQGPQLVAALRARWSRAQWCRLYAFRILPCVALVRLGLHRAAFALYRGMVAELRG